MTSVVEIGAAARKQPGMRFVQAALNGTPVGVAFPPALVRAGNVLYARDLGIFYIRVAGPGGAVPIWIILAGGPPFIPNLAAVLAVGNDSGPNGILLQPAQRLDTDAPGPLRLGTVNANAIWLGNATSPPGTDPLVLINQDGVQIAGSNAGVQYSTTRANRAQFRGNQFGPNNAAPGITGFKSRAAAIGNAPAGFVGVQAGDLLFRITAIGVAPDNVSIPLAGLVTIQVPPGGAVAGNPWCATELELQLVPLEGPVNGAKVMFKVTSQGVPVLRETALPGGGKAAGVAVLDANGQLTIPNPNVKAATRVLLTVQDGGTLATGVVQVVARNVGVDFTIKSSAGVVDAGVHVYWQLWEGI